MDRFLRWGAVFMSRTSDLIDRHLKIHIPALGSVVYFLLISKGVIKIGYTSRGAGTRRFEGKLFNQGKCKIIGIMPGDSTTEKLVHARFDSNRLERESFRDSKPLRRFIKAHCL